MRIFGLGDLHADFVANRELLSSLSSIDYADDALLVAGDVAHRLARLRTALAQLRRRFARVFFVPGNHDLWVAGAAGEVVAETSLDRIAAIRRACTEEGVETAAARVGGLLVVPLLSWYEPGLDGDGVDAADEEMRRLGRRWADRRYCRWPSDLADDPARCRHFAAANDAASSASSSVPVLSFSHFAPRLDLLPGVESLRFRHLPRVAGTPRLETQIRSGRSVLHLFGHTHIPWDATLDGVRYVNAPLGYPRERARWGREGIRLALLWEEGTSYS